MAHLEHGRCVRRGHPSATVPIRVRVTTRVWDPDLESGRAPPADPAETITAETAVCDIVIVSMHPGERPSDVAAAVAALAVVVG